MNEMEIDIKNGRGIGLLSHNVRFPDFVKESFWHRLYEVDR
jgi:hypothetical protein